MQEDACHRVFETVRMIFSHNNPFGFLQDLTPLRSVSLPHPYVWDAMRGGWTSYYTSSLVCILFSGSARWLNFHQNLAKFHLEMNSFTSQTTDESQFKSFQTFPNLPISMASRFSMACSWPVVATRIMRSIRIVIWSFFLDKGLTWSLYPRIHTQNHLHSVSIDGSN